MFYFLVTSSSPCHKDWFANLYFLQVLYWSSLQLGGSANQWFVAVDLLIFRIRSDSNLPTAKVWHTMNIVPSSTRCTGNLNRKDRIVKVRFLTAMRGTSWQSIIDGPRWKRVLSYHELPVCELKFASCDRFDPIAMEGSSS